MPRGIRATAPSFEDQLLDWVLEGEFNHVRAHLNVANKLFAKRVAANTGVAEQAQTGQGSQGGNLQSGGNLQRRKPGPPPGTHRKKSFSATEPVTSNPPSAPTPDPESEFAFAGFDNNTDNSDNGPR